MVLQAEEGGTFNPDIGLNLDLLSTLEGKSSASSKGVELRGMEIGFESAVDPYADFKALALLVEEGAELHEVSVVFPYLPGGISLKTGKFFASFGRWNAFHLHALPFASEPRLYREYAGGSLLMKGLEVSWLPSLPFYMEGTFQLFDLFSADSHDRDPSPTHELPSPFNVDELAEGLGLTDKHGSGTEAHWHDPNNGNALVYYNEVLSRAESEGVEISEPREIEEITHWQNLVYGTRIKTAFSHGSSWSSEWGLSSLFRIRDNESSRVSGEYYSRLLYGGDITFFYDPPGRSLYKGLKTGLEYLGTYRAIEVLEDESPTREYLHRGGFHIWTQVKHSKRWYTAAYADVFQKNIRNFENTVNVRTGANITGYISHFQYLRLEYTYYDYPSEIENIHRISLQYNATIGYHTHGMQR